MISWSKVAAFEEFVHFHVRSSALSFDQFANDYAVSKQFAPEPVKGSTTMERRAASAGVFEATAARRFALTNQNPAPPIRTSNAAIPMVTGRSAERFGAANCRSLDPYSFGGERCVVPLRSARCGFHRPDQRLDLFPKLFHEHVGAVECRTVIIRRGCWAPRRRPLSDLAPSQVVSQ